MRNKKNEVAYILMKEFDSNRLSTKKEIEQHCYWRNVPREIQDLFYRAYNHVNKLSDKVVYKLLDNDEEDFDYSSDEYLEFVLAEEQFYDFIYYILDKKYGLKNCLPY